MFPLEEFRESLQRLVTILRDCEIRFYVTGGAAAVAYGDPRMTQDVDLVIEGTALKDRLPEFLSLVGRNGFLSSEAAVREALRLGRQFQLIDLALAMKIDIYPSDFVVGAMERVVEMQLFPGLSLPVASRVDLAVSKLIWISRGSHKSRRDLRQLLLRARDNERQQLHDLAGSLGVVQLLTEVLAEPDELDA